MKLPRPFLRLPLRFDAAQLAREVAQFAESDWQRHPTGYAGNSAIRLISAGGGENDAIEGAMQPAAALARCGYIRQILADFGVVWGRSRLMRLAPHTGVPEHADINHHWFYRVRVHIPIVTHPDVRFHCGDAQVHMGAGECWLFDNWRLHRVDNASDVTRVHLVADTVGNAAFWQAVEQNALAPAEPRLLPYTPGRTAGVLTEREAPAGLIPPAEVDYLLGDLVADLAPAQDTPEARGDAARFRLLVTGYCRDWRALWTLHGDAPAHRDAYRALCAGLRRDVQPLEASVVMRSNRMSARLVLEARVLQFAMRGAEPAAAPGEYSAQPVAATRPPRPHRAAAEPFDRPIFIVAAPRSGSTLLFETLARSPALWTAGDETHALVEGHAELRPDTGAVESNRLKAAHATPALRDAIRAAFAAELRDSGGRPWRDGAVRVLEKTPKNALRIPFFDALFPDARFIFLWREPEPSLGSIIDVWNDTRWITYRELPDWDGPWSLLLPPGWQQLRGRPLEEIAAHQWRATNETVLQDLGQLRRDRWTSLRYEDFLADPAAAVQRLCEFAEIPVDAALRAHLGRPLPLSRYTQSPPAAEKWRRHAAAIARVLPPLAPVHERLRELAAARVHA